MSFFADIMSGFEAWWAQVGTIELGWLIFGFGAQAMFFMRFLAQWIVTERNRKSVVPEIFWYFSLAGGLMMLVYAIHRADPPIILGQMTGLFIYSRNIYFIWREKLGRS
ncbi:lipid-A-disaccharide synthase N-terminal domain-containing protein [Rhodovibrionaceae bacterium A322]